MSTLLFYFSIFYTYLCMIIWPFNNVIKIQAALLNIQNIQKPIFYCQTVQTKMNLWVHQISLNRITKRVSKSDYCKKKIYFIIS